MTEFAVHVTTDAGTVTDAQFDELTTALAPVHGLPGVYHGQLTVQATSETQTFGQAVDIVTEAVLSALRGAGVPGSVEKVEVQTQQEFEEFGHRPLDPVKDPAADARLREVLAAVREARRGEPADA